MRTYHLYATVSAGAANQANLMIQRSGRIKSVRWAVSVDAPADNAAVELEISTVATLGINTHESPNVIDAVKHLTNMTTSGANAGCINTQRILDFPVAQGERIYLHSAVAGTVSAKTDVLVDVDER